MFESASEADSKALHIFPRCFGVISTSARSGKPSDTRPRAEKMEEGGLFWLIVHTRNGSGAACPKGRDCGGCGEAPTASTLKPRLANRAPRSLERGSGPQFALTLAERTLTLHAASVSDAHEKRHGNGTSPHAREGRRGSTVGRTPVVPMLPSHALASFGGVLSSMSHRGELL